MRELLPVTCWRHCPGIDNPADIPSRGLTPIELHTNKLWHCGPDWLHQGPGERVPGRKGMPEDCLGEMKVADGKTCSLLVGDTTGLKNVIKCRNYSTLSRLLTVTAYVRKFVLALKEAVKNHSSPWWQFEC